MPLGSHYQDYSLTILLSKSKPLQLSSQTPSSILKHNQLKYVARESMGKLIKYKNLKQKLSLSQKADSLRTKHSAKDL